MAANASLPLNALLFALGAAVAFAGLDLAQKWSARYAVPTPAAFLALRLLAGAVLSPLLLLLPGALVDRHVVLAPLLGLIVMNLLGSVLYLISVYRAEISVVGSLWPLKSIYLPLLAFVLPPHLVFPGVTYLLILAATAGAILISWNGRLRAAAFRETPVLLMVFVTVPVFALSDYFLNQVVTPMGSPLATTVTAWALAILAVPVVLAHPPSRGVVARSIANRRGLIGALLTGLFLVAGVACIGAAFRRGGAGGLVLVNVYAMLSGIVLLLVNAGRPGWLERETAGVYGLRLCGAALLIAAAGALQQVGASLH
jgi:hypothetical protein